HFSRDISSLKRIVENKGRKRIDIAQALSGMMLKGDEDEALTTAKRKERSNFELFLAVSNSDAMVYESDVKEHERGYAIWHVEKEISQSGVAVVFLRDVIAWGNPQAADMIIEGYKAWESLGKPGLADYQLSFYPAGMAAPHLTDKEWAVSRKSGTTVFSLKTVPPK
ncbi:MAG: hypothetical protein QME74_03770, partial [Candidatus Edwardsbacteria bacterium]|nr:hypothetical protein [Candidatus Edwardsbacteria bacterium]